MRKIVHLLLPIIVVSMVFPSLSTAETEIKCSISAGEEYNDNVNDTSDKKADFITFFSPTVHFLYTGNRVKAAIDYSGTLRIYDTGQRTNEILNSLAATASAEVVENLLVVDVSDTNQMVFSDTTQGTPNTSDSTRNQVNQNSFAAGATLTPHFGDRTQFKLGYRFTGTAYASGTGVNKYDQQGFLDVLYELTPTLEIGANSKVIRQTSDGGDVTRYYLTAVTRYTYSEGCYIYIQGGGVESVYDLGGNKLLPSWSAGWNHVIGRSGISLQTSGDYVDNPSTIYNSFRATYSATLYHDFDRARVAASVSYSDYTGQDTGHSKDVTANVNLNYEITPRLGASVSLGLVNTIGSSNNFATLSNSNNTQRLYGSAELNYQLPKDFSVKAYYRNKTSLAGSGNFNTYNSNIVGVGLTKTF